MLARIYPSIHVSSNTKYTYIHTYIHQTEKYCRKIMESWIKEVPSTVKRTLKKGEVAWSAEKNDAPR